MNWHTWTSLETREEYVFVLLIYYAIIMYNKIKLNPIQSHCYFEVTLMCTIRKVFNLNVILILIKICVLI